MWGEPGHSRTSTAMIAEMAGAPGAGKSTVRARVVGTLTSAGIDTMTLEDAISPAVKCTPLGRLIGRLLPEGRVRRALEWRLYAMSRLFAGVATLAARPGLVRLLLATQPKRPRSAQARRRKVLSWLLRASGAARYLGSRTPAETVLVVDEGMVHRTVQLFTSPTERADRLVIETYVDRVVRPDLVLLVDAPADVCADRALARGVLAQWDWSDDEVRAYIRNAHEAVTMTCEALGRHGVPVVVIDNATDGDDRWTDDLLAAMAASPDRTGP